MSTVVVGAGISGLATAFALQMRGEDVQVLEAAERVGGVIRSVQRDGFTLECAANGYLDREPATRDLVSALGLGERVRPADAASKLRFIFTRGALRAVPSSPPAFFKSDVVPFGTKLRLAAELFSRRGPAEDESIAEFARRHVGARATAALIDAAQTGIFAGDVEKLSAEATFPKMVAIEREHRSLILGMLRQQKAKRLEGDQGLSGLLCSFDRGMETLPQALSLALGDRVKLRTPVRAIEPAQAGWRVQTDEGPIDAARVVLATPAWISAKWLGALDPALAAELEAIFYAPISVVHLAFRGLESPPRGFGFLVPGEEKRRVLGALHVSTFFPWRAPADGALVTVMVGGARSPELAAIDDAAIVAMVREELASILGLTPEPTWAERIRWERGIPQYEVGHLARLRRIDACLAKHPGLHLTGNAYRGVGVNDCIRNAGLLADALTAKER